MEDSRVRLLLLGVGVLSTAGLALARFEIPNDYWDHKDWLVVLLILALAGTALAEGIARKLQEDRCEVDRQLRTYLEGASLAIARVEFPPLAA
jgi:hypothetical protein